MSGVHVDTGGKGGRRAVDGEINMIPMIDLLVCCISFLLITAVWSHMSRLDADAEVPGPNDGAISPRPPDKVLHVEMRSEDEFTLLWKQGATVIGTIDVPRRAVETVDGNATIVRYPELAARLMEEWKANGSHRDASDKVLDQAVLHADDKTAFRELVAVIDAIYAPKRDVRAAKQVPAFNVAFATN